MVTASFNNKPPFKAGDKLKNKILDGHDTTLPVASRILRVTLKHPKGGRVKIESENHKDNIYEVAFGKPWTEEEFVREAHRRGHPAHLYQALSDSMLQAIDANVKMRLVDIVEHRVKWLRKWMSRAVELKGREEEREIFEAEGYPDISICDDLAKGFPFVGLCGESEALPPDFQPATLSIPDLEALSGRENKSILHSTKGSGESLVDSELWHKTLEEEKKGFLDGTLTRKATKLGWAHTCRPLE